MKTTLLCFYLLTLQVSSQEALPLLQQLASSLLSGGKAERSPTLTPFGSILRQLAGQIGNAPPPQQPNNSQPPISDVAGLLNQAHMQGVFSAGEPSEKERSLQRRSLNSVVPVDRKTTERRQEVFEGIQRARKRAEEMKQLHLTTPTTTTAPKTTAPVSLTTKRERISRLLRRLKTEDAPSQIDVKHISVDVVELFTTPVPQVYTGDRHPPGGEYQLHKDLLYTFFEGAPESTGPPEYIFVPKEAEAKWKRATEDFDAEMLNTFIAQQGSRGLQLLPDNERRMLIDAYKRNQKNNENSLSNIIEQTPRPPIDRRILRIFEGSNQQQRDANTIQVNTPDSTHLDLVRKFFPLGQTSTIPTTTTTTTTKRTTTMATTIPTTTKGVVTMNPEQVNKAYAQFLDLVRPATVAPTIPPFIQGFLAKAAQQNGNSKLDLQTLISQYIKSGGGGGMEENVIEKPDNPFETEDLHAYSTENRDGDYLAISRLPNEEPIPVDEDFEKEMGQFNMKTAAENHEPNEIPWRNEPATFPIEPREVSRAVPIANTVAETTTTLNPVAKMFAERLPDLTKVLFERVSGASFPDNDEVLKSPMNGGLFEMVDRYREQAMARAFQKVEEIQQSRQNLLDQQAKHPLPTETLSKPDSEVAEYSPNIANLELQHVYREAIVPSTAKTLEQRMDAVQDRLSRLREMMARSRAEEEAAIVPPRTWPRAPILPATTPSPPTTPRKNFTKVIQPTDYYDDEAETLEMPSETIPNRISGLQLKDSMAVEKAAESGLGMVTTRPAPFLFNSGLRRGISPTNYFA